MNGAPGAALVILAAIVVASVYDAAPRVGAPLLVIVVLLMLGNALRSGALKKG